MPASYAEAAQIINLLNYLFVNVATAQFSYFINFFCYVATAQKIILYTLCYCTTTKLFIQCYGSGVVYPVLIFKTWQLPESRSRIHNNKTEEVKKIFCCLSFFRDYKFHRKRIFNFLTTYRKKLGPTDKEVNYLLTNKFVLSSQKCVGEPGFGIRKKLTVSWIRRRKKITRSQVRNTHFINYLSPGSK